MSAECPKEHQASKVIPLTFPRACRAQQGARADEAPRPTLSPVR
jgi:hypothetical protein